MKRQSTANLPLDLWDEILPRVPVKSLLRFRSVSKSWQALIDHPNFALIRSNTNNQITLIQSQHFRYSQSILIYTNDFKLLQTYNLPLYTLTVAGYIDGIFMLKCWRTPAKNDGLMLWNPSINKVRILPSYPLMPYIVDIGLGFDPSINDYKYVSLVLMRYQHQFVHSVLVYTFGTNSWKENPVDYQSAKGFSIDGLFNSVRTIDGVSRAQLRTVCIRSVLYFTVKITDDQYLIASYGFSSEDFSYAKLPADENINPSMCSEDGQNITSANHGSSLGLIYLRNSSGSFWLAQAGLRADHITWTKVYSFALTTPVGYCFGTFLYLNNNDEMVIQWSDMVIQASPMRSMQGSMDNRFKRMVTSYNHKTKMEKVLMNKSSYLCQAYPYVESLMLRNG